MADVAPEDAARGARNRDKLEDAVAFVAGLVLGYVLGIVVFIL